METIVGIDLGTTNSLVATVRDGLPVALAVDDGGGVLLASVAGWDEQGGLLVGAAARHQYLLRPTATVRSVKRHMGDDDWHATLGSTRYDAPGISALILARLKAVAQEHLGAVTKAVITVPAYFGDPQRRATLEAGRRAGLEVVRLVNEPTAAALAYTLVDGQDQRVLVYDLGGGTFDVSVVDIAGGVCEVLASHGNRELGGDDFDRRLVDHLADRFALEFGQDLRQDPVAMARLFDAAERAKIALSTEGSTIVREEFIATDNGTPLHLECQVTRQEFEALIMPLLESTRASVRTVLRDAALSPSQIRRVLLVGGSTRIPAVSELLADEMGSAPHREIDPDQAVALGAATLGATIGGERLGVFLVDVCSHSLGIDARDEEGEIRFTPIIARNTVLPVRRSRLFYTAAPWVSEVHMAVLEGESADPDEDTRLGDLMLKSIAPMPDRDQQREVHVHFEYDLSGTLSVTATDRQGAHRVDAQFRPGGGGDQGADLGAEAADLLRQIEALQAGDTLPEAARQEAERLAAATAQAMTADAEAAWCEAAATFLYEYEGP